MSNIPIIAQPDHFIEGVLCPFCKKPTLGTVEIPGEGRTLYSMTCFYSDCVLNFMTPVSWEFDHIIKDMVATGALQQ